MVLYRSSLIHLLIASGVGVLRAQREREELASGQRSVTGSSWPDRPLDRFVVLWRFGAAFRRTKQAGWAWRGECEPVTEHSKSHLGTNSLEECAATMRTISSFNQSIHNHLNTFQTQPTFNLILSNISKFTRIYIMIFQIKQIFHLIHLYTVTQHCIWRVG